MTRRLAILLALLLAPLALTAGTPGDALRARLAAARPGDTVTVPAGEFDGPFVVETSIRLIGESGAVLRGDGRGHVLAVRAPDVAVSGFTVRGSGRELAEDHAAIHITGARAVIRGNRVLDSLHGIYVRQADHCVIADNVVLGDAAAASVDDPLPHGLKPGESELCDIESPQDRRGNGIHLWNSVGHTLTGNVVRGTRDGIYFSFVDRSTTRGNRISHVRYGLHYMYSDENTFEDNVFTQNAAGAALMYSKGLVLRGNRFAANRSHRAYGLLLQSVDDTRIEANVIEGNTLGLYLENCNTNTFRANRLAGNHVALRLNGSSGDNRFFENTFAGNIHAVETSGRAGTNVFAHAGRGNRWEGALALDLDRDGVADVPHREPDVFGAWRRPFPAIGLLSASPGERLLRFIHSRLALPGLPGVTDPAPLTGASSP